MEVYIVMNAFFRSRCHCAIAKITGEWRIAASGSLGSNDEGRMPKRVIDEVVVIVAVEQVLLSRMSNKNIKLQRRRRKKLKIE